MADRYWVGGTGTWNNSTTTNWAASSGGAGGETAPTSTDNVFFDTSSGSGTVTIASTAACADLTVAWTAVKTNIWSLSGNFTITGNVSIAGNSAINRILVQSNTIGTARTITVNGTNAWNNVDFMDITAAGSASWDLSSSSTGDCGGNTGITFATSATQTWNGTSGGNWSTNAWTTRVPLPQDDVVISSAFSASQTVTQDMPRFGRSINWTGATGTPTFAIGIDSSFFGSLTLISGMNNVTGVFTLFPSGRSSYSITSAGKTYAQVFNFRAPGGTYTLNDALSTTNNIAYSNGTFNSNNFNVTAAVHTGSGTATRSITYGTSNSTLNTTASTNAWMFATVTGLTFSGASSTITVGAASVNTRSFQGGGLTYGTLTYILSGSTGALNIVGANSFAGINFSDASNARSLQFTAGTTTTLRSAAGWQVNGTSGKLMTVQSITAATHTISCASGIVQSDYLNLVNSIATGGAVFYAGSHSTDGGGNSGWIFSDPPQPRAASPTQSNANLLNLQRI